MMRRAFTTAQLLTNVLFHLAASLEYVQLLPQEAQLVHAQTGGESSVESMGQLKKIDSFIKESQRHFTAAAITFHRKRLSAIILSEGTYLPANTCYLFSPSAAISGDPSTYEIPEEFDSLRLDMLQQRTPENDMRYQLTSTSSTQMHFGLGRHVCPGR
jgi:cytochrome P450